MTLEPAIEELFRPTMRVLSHHYSADSGSAVQGTQKLLKADEFFYRNILPIEKVIATKIGCIGIKSGTVLRAANNFPQESLKVIACPTCLLEPTKKSCPSRESDGKYFPKVLIVDR